MELPSYFLTRPLPPPDAETAAAFDKVFEEAIARDGVGEIDYRLAAPKWQFLCYLCDHKEIVLHGSGSPDITVFEPRQSNDVAEFGNREGVYAASDGIWPIYFAIVDRDNYINSLINTCFRIVEGPGTVSEPYYFFSVNADALCHYPWRNGTVYLLPRQSFEQQPVQSYRGVKIDMAHWASLSPVTPLAKLSVGPTDFPFLTSVRSHDPAVLGERAASNPDEFPWVDE